MPGLNPLRHQLASTSPVHLRGLVVAAAAQGDPTQRLRRVIRAEYRVSDAVLCGSGTEALVLAFETAERLLEAPAGLVLPAFSCFDVAAAAVRFGRPVTFYDIDPHTMGPELESLEHALATGSHIVLIASLFGISPDWRALDPVLASADAFIVEDAAQGHGGRWEGSPLGGHGRLGVLSFGRGKGWTGGEGGALLIRDERDRDAVVRPLQPARPGAVILAKATAQWALGRPSLYGIPRAIPSLALGQTQYRDVGIPRDMSPVAAALALGTKAQADACVEVRRARSARYTTLLANAGFSFRLRLPPGSEAGFSRFPAVLPRGMGTFRSPATALRLGAAPGYPAALPHLDQVRPLLSAPPQLLPGARTLVQQLVTFPTHPMVRHDEQDRLVELLSSQ